MAFLFFWVPRYNAYVTGFIKNHADVPFFLYGAFCPALAFPPNTLFTSNPKPYSVVRPSVLDLLDLMIV